MLSGAPLPKRTLRFQRPIWTVVLSTRRNFMCSLLPDADSDFKEDTLRGYCLRLRLR